MTLVAVIPARMSSTRFPGKPLADLCGKPMIQWVYEATCKASSPVDVVIATPDEEIVERATSFGARAILTRHDHPTGTDRIAEAAGSLDADAFLNVQGDEPLIDPAAIDICAMPLVEGRAEMASVYDLAQPSEIDNPNVVKVVTDLRDRALYFSRSPVPHYRERTDAPTKKHVGLYAYTRGVLERFSRWQPTPLEQTEMLEPLRFLENGVSIQMSRARGTALAVDTPEQADEVSRLLTNRG